MKVAVYSPNWIGDAIMAIPFIQELKKQNSKAELFVICKTWVSGVYKNHDAIDQLIPIPDDDLYSLPGTIKTGLMLRAIKFDLFYTLTDSFRSAFILWLSGSKRRYGYATQMRSFLLTRSKIIPSEIMHRSKKYLGLLDVDSNTMIYPRLCFTDSEKSWAKEELSKMGFKNPVAILPYSVEKNRTLPNELLRRWIKESEDEYLVFGSKTDLSMGNSLIDSCEDISIKSICGFYTLRESMVLLSLCNFTIATDSGLGHISAALGIPTISFFGVGNKEITAPLGKKTYVLRYCNACGEKKCFDENKEIICIKKIKKIDIENAVNSMSFL